ncbi:hypothetical protein GCM10009576_040660 [Streptomyces rhizosphaericus]|uniref:Uncharacterized protein n=1 Tax=Streptomyces rhizosphaericus TaxID=114699 RepID=A0ABN1SBD8_9ACTN
MCGGAHDPDATAAVFDHREDVHPRAGQGDRLKSVQARRVSAWERRKSAHVLELPSVAGSTPASFRLFQTVDAAAFTPSTSSSR